MPHVSSPIHTFINKLEEERVVVREVIPLDVVGDSSLASMRLEHDASDMGPAFLVSVCSEHGLEIAISEAAKHGIRVLVRGGASGVSGALLPLEGPFLEVDMKSLSGLGEYDPETHRATFLAGTIGAQAERLVQEHGRTLGNLPMSMSMSTIGGWVATDAVGLYSSRFGRTSDLVAAITVVDGTGTTRRIESTDPDFWWFVGSEGEFGVITRVELVTFPAHDVHMERFGVDSMDHGVALIRSLMNEFPSPMVCRIHDPVDSVVYGLAGQGGGRIAGIMRDGVMRMARGRVFEALREGLKTLGARHVILIGHEPGPVWDRIRSFMAAHGATHIGEVDAQEWIASRERAAFDVPRLWVKGMAVDTVEFSVPWPRVTAVVREVGRLLDTVGANGVHVAHPDGIGASVYFTVAIPRSGLDAYDRVLDEAISTALALGASLSHHHGVGVVRRQHLPVEHGAALGLMAQAKDRFDPKHIFGRGTFYT